MKTIQACLFFLCAFAMSTPAAIAAPLRIQRLSDFGSGAAAYAINNAGQIVGTAITDYPTAVVWNNNSPALISVPYISYANSISENGKIAGDVATYWADYSYTSAFMGGSLIYADAGIESGASGINNSGSAVGFSKFGATPGNVKFDMDLPNHATLWNGPTAIDLHPAGAASSYASAINNAGTIVGSADANAALWNNGIYTNLGTGRAFAVNENGVVAGISGTDAVLWSDGNMISLGSGTANDVNLAGQVVGTSGGFATLWSEGQSFNLDSLLPVEYKNAGLILDTAMGINDAGWIIANAYNAITGESRAFLISPIPEPPKFLMLLSGLFVLLGYKSRNSEQSSSKHF